MPASWKQADQQDGVGVADATTLELTEPELPDGYDGKPLEETGDTGELELGLAPQ